MPNMEDILTIGKLVDPLLIEYLRRDISNPLQNIVLHQFKAGGKRIRAALAILSCEASGCLREQGLNGAALVELIHNYSLILDDIIDRGDIRRGSPTTRAVYTEAMALLAAMCYRESITELANACHNPEEVRHIMVSTIREVIEGERLDILMEQSGRSGKYIEKNRLRSISFKDYVGMIGKKTASLIKASCEVGCVEAGASENFREALSKYGWHVGLAFQVADDFLDIFGEKTGKTKGKDIIEHKLGNVVILYSLQSLSDSDRKALLTTIRKDTISKNDLVYVLALIDKTDARSESKRLAYKYIEESKRNLTILPDTEAKRNLLFLADFIIKRTY